MPFWTRNMTFSAATSPGPHGLRKAAALPSMAFLPVANWVEKKENRAGASPSTWKGSAGRDARAWHGQRESWDVFLALKNVLMRAVIRKAGRMVNQERRSARQWDKRERGQHKAEKQMLGAEAASGRGQLCSPPRWQRKGKAKSGSHTPRSVGKGTPGIAEEEGAPTAGAQAEIPVESSTPRADQARVREQHCPTTAASPSLGPAEPLTYHEQWQNIALTLL